MDTIKPLQASNIARLAKALLTESFKVGFDMDDFAIKLGPAAYLLPSQVRNVCGTTCCALGHAPLALPDERPGRDESWESYGDRLFCISGSESWDFLFDKRWPDDKRQFAARAIHLLRGKSTEFIDGSETYPVPKPASFDKFIVGKP